MLRRRPRRIRLPPSFFVQHHQHQDRKLQHFSKLITGLSLLFGFVPSSRLSPMHIEFKSSWTSQTLQSIRALHPIDASFCWVQRIVRFCGGLSTTILFSNPSRTNDELHFQLGGNLRIGTELFHHGPFSIRADIFGRAVLARRPLGKTLGVTDEPTPFAGGVAVMGVRSFD